MKPISFDEARSSALTALAHLRGNEAERLAVIELLDAMVATYQARLLECSDTEAPVIRIAAKQLVRLRSGLTEKEIKSVGLFLP